MNKNSPSKPTKDVASLEFMNLFRQFIGSHDPELLPDLILEFMSSDFLLLLEEDEDENKEGSAGEDEMVRIVSVMDQENNVLFAAFTSEEHLRKFGEGSGQTLTLAGHEIYDLVWGHHDAIVLNPDGKEQMLIPCQWLEQICGPRNPELVAALAEHQAAPNPETRQAVIDALAQAQVLIACDEAPDDDCFDEIGQLKEDTDLSVKYTVSPDTGKRFLLLFSDVDELMARAPETDWISCPTKMWLSWARACEGVVVNAEGDWIELIADELSGIESRAKPAHIHGEHCRH